MVSQDRAKAKQVGSYGVASGSQINVRDKRKLSQLDSRKGVSNDFLKKDKGKQRFPNPSIVIYHLFLFQIQNLSNFLKRKVRLVAWGGHLVLHHHLLTQVLLIIRLNPKGNVNVSISHQRT